MCARDGESWKKKIRRKLKKKMKMKTGQKGPIFAAAEEKRAVRCKEATQQRYISIFGRFFACAAAALVERLFLAPFWYQIKYATMLNTLPY